MFKRHRDCSIYVVWGYLSSSTVRYRPPQTSISTKTATEDGELPWQNKTASQASGVGLQDQEEGRRCCFQQASVCFSGSSKKVV